VLDLEAALSAATAAQEEQQDEEEKQEAAGGRAPRPTPGGSAVVARPELGLVVFHTHRVYQEAWRVYRLRDRSSKYSEWPRLMVSRGAGGGGKGHALMIYPQSREWPRLMVSKGAGEVLLP
jgi:hypothetical protein